MTARDLLRKYGLHAKKSWGQNFLVSEPVYDAIVRAAVDRPDARLVEIGAGLGTLTRRLADAAPKGYVVAVERERDMVTVLTGELGNHPRVGIREANALTLDYAALASAAGEPLVVVGNLPYQIASPLLFSVVAARAHVRRAVVMLQAEMAARLCAEPGTREASALTVLVGAFMQSRVVVHAPPGAFVPSPRVDSTVVLLTPRPAAAIDPGRAEVFRRLVNAGFGQRRKTLRNALKSVPGALDALTSANIEAGRRAETLTLPEWARLSAAL